MKKSIVLFAFILFSTVTIYAQNTVQVNLLQDEWYAQENNANYKLHFLTANTVSFKENNIENTYTFSVTNDVLIFNGRNFSILELNTTTLKLEETGTPTNTFNFKKVQHMLPPIPPGSN